MQPCITSEYRHWARNGKSENEEIITSNYYTLNSSIYKGGGSNGATSSSIRENDRTSSWRWEEDSRFFCTSTSTAKQLHMLDFEGK